MNAPKKAAAFSAMIPATAPPANRANRAETQKRLIIAGCAFSIPIRTDSRCSEEQEAGARNPRWCVSIVMSKSPSLLVVREGGTTPFDRVDHRCKSTLTKIFQPALDRFRYYANQAGHSPSATYRKPHQRSEICDKRVAIVLQVEFERLGRKDHCAPRRPVMPSRKRQRGPLEQENPANLTFGVTRHPKAMCVATDEKCRNRLADDVYI